MSYREITINGQQIKLIPLGDCACGCGGKTTIAQRSCPSRCIVKGQLNKCKTGHRASDTGKIINTQGYPMTKCVGHPRSTQLGHYVCDHILVAEKALGKMLPIKAEVHHVNGTCNSGPLVICEDSAYHRLLHIRTMALKECGHANWRKCCFCKQWDESKNLYIGSSVYHPICINQYHKERRKSIL